MLCPAWIGLKEVDARDVRFFAVRQGYGLRGSDFWFKVSGVGVERLRSSGM